MSATEQALGARIVRCCHAFVFYTLQWSTASGVEARVFASRDHAENHARWLQLCEHPVGTWIELVQLGHVLEHYYLTNDGWEHASNVVPLLWYGRMGLSPELHACAPFESRSYQGEDVIAWACDALDGIQTGLLSLHAAEVRYELSQRGAM